RRALPPLRVGAVDVDAQHRALVAAGAVAALALEGAVNVLAAVHVVQRAEEQLPPRGPQQVVEVRAVRQAGLPAAGAGDLVAEVAVDPLGGHAANLPEVEVILGGRNGGWGVTGGADAGALWPVAQQAPAAAGPAVPVGAVVEVQEVAV